MSTLLLEREGEKGRRVDVDPSTKEDSTLVVPAVYRVFSPDARVIGSCFIYHPVRERSTGEARVRVRGSIQQGGAIIRKLVDSLHTLSAGEQADAIPLEFHLPLAELGRGIYSLNVQALDEVDGRGVVQNVEFMLR
jgi:hypothetical protein